jgi:alpha-amylase
MSALPRECSKRGIEFKLPSEVLAEQPFESAHHLPLPIFPTTWAGSGGMEFFLGNAAQQAIFQLMLHTYNVARLTETPELVDMALWLLQSDNLHLIQWFGRTGEEAEVSAYFTPREWWNLGPDQIIIEQQRVYQNALYAMEHYLPSWSEGPAGVPTRVQGRRPLLTGSIEQRY